MVFAACDVVLVLAMATLFDGTLQWFAMLVAAAVCVGTLVPLWLLVASLNAVIELPELLARVTARHTAAGEELVTHLRDRQGRALRRLAVREAVPVLRSAYDVRGATTAAIALARLNPFFLLVCGICLAVQFWVIVTVVPLLTLGSTT